MSGWKRGLSSQRVGLLHRRVGDDEGAAMISIEAALAKLEGIFLAAGVGSDPLEMRETPMLDAIESPARPVVVTPVIPTQAKPKVKSKAKTKKKRVRVRKPAPKKEKVYPPHILEAVQYVQPRNQTPPYTLHSLYMDMRKRGCPEIEGKDRRTVAELAGWVVMKINGVEQVMGRKG